MADALELGVIQLPRQDRVDSVEKFTDGNHLVAPVAIICVRISWLCVTAPQILSMTGNLVGFSRNVIAALLVSHFAIQRHRPLSVTDG